MTSTYWTTPSSYTGAVTSIGYIDSISYRPGIKTKQDLKASINQEKIDVQNSFIKHKISKEIKKLYRTSSKCL